MAPEPDQEYSRDYSGKPRFNQLALEVGILFVVK